MKIYRPSNVLSGFHAEAPCANLPELLYVAEVWRPEKWEVHRHQHTEHWEVKLQVAGEATWQLADKTVRLTSGDLLVLPPSAPHQLMKAAKGRRHVIFLGLEPAAIFKRVPGLEESWSRVTEACVVPGAEAVRVPMRLLIREVRSDRPQRAEAIRSTLDLIAVEVGRSIVAAQERELLPRHPAVADACRLLEEHSEKPWRLHELGRFVGLSPNHLATLFKNELGTTPHQYLLQARIAKARSLLKTTDMSVTDIAFEVGFTSSQHFARVFKKLESCSARDFRQKAG